MAGSLRSETCKRDKSHKNVAAETSLTRSQRLQLLKGAVGIYFFFIQYGKLQDWIFRFRSPSGERFTEVWFLQVIDALANVLVAGIGRAWNGKGPDLPQHFLACSGLGQVISKYCFSASLASGLSFHIATLAKSAKMVPVMLGSLISGGHRYSVRRVSQAAAIVGGTSLVTLADGAAKQSRRSSFLGLAYIAVALSCDGLIGGVQQRLKDACMEKKKELRPYDMMFWANFYMALAAFGFAAALGELRTGFNFCRRSPEIFWRVIQFGACGALGQVCIFQVIAAFGPVRCTAITTTRKLASALLSVFASGTAELPPLGWGGLSLASVGILGELA